ncbi:hypothetical protein HER32_00255 [Hymenobacter sp. BT18]|uniref:hypothetical protein n=1 Tax=Hymenobacter sp. BT18 TaxID=2835648 RepID=UPI00143E7A4B|nr:hypothetical protein [Hymenobacter sp. BT18]QIX59707.1 hypothetical protein HER32_00255 [Hymenobacter sp. BT18]
MNGPSRDRALYEKAKQMSKNATPTMGFLREEIVLANNNNTYRFGFNEQRSGIRGSEKMLSIKDSFIANRLQLGILVERKTKPGTGVIMTFPNPVVVATAGTTSATDLEVIFNGQLKAQIDQEVLMDGFSTRRFRFVPSTQQQTGAANANNIALSEQRFGDGQVEVEPNIILVGTKRNEFTITLPQFDPSVTPNIAATDAAFDVRLVLELSGFHIPGGAALTK